MICLSKNLKDKAINAFASGANLPIQDFENIPDEPIIFRGMVKKDLIEDRLKSNKTFYYMDTGYIGNYPSIGNPDGHKNYHRIVKNGLQHSNIIERPDDRWIKLKQEIRPWRQHGEHILIVTPSEKPCKFYDIDYSSWLQNKINDIRKHTDRPIKIREKGSRADRIKNTIFEDFKNAHAIVTFNSIAAVESVLYGIPAFTEVTTAADPVSERDIFNIENPTLFDDQLRYKWACHLAYGQFHISEFYNGYAYEVLNEKC